MHTILQELHQDHLNLSRVLGLLEKQLGFIDSGNDVDLHVLSEIIDYVQSYPDLIHHPREDVIFTVYRERGGAELELIERLMEEHRTLIGETLVLKDCVNRWEQDVPVPRQHIATLIADYLRRQWDHLNLEEGSVYKLLAEGLSEADWADIEMALPRGAYPLFAAMARQRYQHIFDQVMAYG